MFARHCRPRPDDIHALAVRAIGFRRSYTEADLRTSLAVTQRDVRYAERGDVAQRNFVWLCL